MHPAQRCDRRHHQSSPGPARQAGPGTGRPPRHARRRGVAIEWQACGRVVATPGTGKCEQGAVSVSRETRPPWFHVKRCLSWRPDRPLVDRPSVGTNTRVIHTKPNPPPSTPQGYPQAISTAGSDALCWRAPLPAEARRASGMLPSGLGLVVPANSQRPSPSRCGAQYAAAKTRPGSADFRPYSSIKSRIGAPRLTRYRA